MTTYRDSGKEDERPYYDYAEVVKVRPIAKKDRFVVALAVVCVVSIEIGIIALPVGPTARDVGAVLAILGVVGLTVAGALGLRRRRYPQIHIPREFRDDDDDDAR